MIDNFLLEEFTPLLLIGEELEKDKTHESSCCNDIIERHHTVNSWGQKKYICRSRDGEEEYALSERDE